MKETGFIHWQSPNDGATNSSGFTGLPGGGWNINDFANINTQGKFWTSTSSSTYGAIYRALYNTAPFLFNLPGGYPKTSCYSIRCIKD